MTLREQVRRFLESHPDVARDLRDGHLSKQAFGRKYGGEFSSDSPDNIARQATYVLREMYSEPGAHDGQDRVAEPTSAPQESTSINESSDHYYYNETDDVYVIPMAHRVKPAIQPGEWVRDLQAEYSNWDGEPSTINEICRTFGIGRRDFKAIKTALEFTHDSSPYTDEQLVTEEVGSLQRDFARRQERALERAIQKDKWAKTEKDARRWREFKRDVIEPMMDGLSSCPVRKSIPQLASPEGDFCVVHNPTDAHLDQMNADGTGFRENRSRWLDAGAACRDEVLAYRDRPERVTLPLGGDQFNIDTAGETTTAGTPQRQSVPHSNAFALTAEAGAEMVEQWRGVAHINVRVILGNHDHRTCLAYYWGLKQRYADCEDVTVLGDAQMFQYERYGANLFGFTHGHKIKGGETRGPGWLAKKMATDSPSMWGESRSRYWFVGHRHFLQEKDDGALVMQAPTIAPHDEWHEGEGYGGGHQVQCAYVFRKDRGQVARFMGWA